MKDRAVGWLTVISGSVIVLVSLTAGITGFGDSIIGPRPIGGTVLGLVALFVGLLLLRYS